MTLFDMTLTVYHLKTCDTCRKAVKSLKAAGHNLTLIDVRAEGVPPSELENIVDKAGWETVLNTRSTTWRGLSDSEKTNIGRDKALSLMGAHPTLIKRPMIVAGDEVYVGWKSDVQDRLLGR